MLLWRRGFRWLRGWRRILFRSRLVLGLIGGLLGHLFLLVGVEGKQVFGVKDVYLRE